METDSFALLDDSLWNFDGEWDSVSTNRVREWHQIKNVLRINKGKPKDYEFDLSLNLNICKPKSCIREKFGKVWKSWYWRQQLINKKKQMILSE